MGDFSGVRLGVSLEDFRRVKAKALILDLAPTDTYTPDRDPLGRGKGMADMAWEELRSGIEDERFTKLREWMKHHNINYVAWDDGCPGAWSEEQEIHQDGTVGRRPLIEADPAMNRSLYMAAKNSLAPEELANWVDAWFDDNPKGWVW